MPINDRDKRRKYGRDWVARRRKSYFQNRLCNSCGSDIDLQLHHKDPSKKISHAIWSWRKDRREAELKKCITLCKSCHRELHRKRMTKPIVHGTGNGYTEKGCRCGECRRWQRERMRIYRNKFAEQTIVG